MHEQFRRRRLPHWDVPGATYFVTACLDGSIPAQGLLEIAEYRKSLEQRPRPDTMSEEDWQHHRSKLVFRLMDEWMDDRPAVRHLEQPALAEIVTNALRHFDGDRYELNAFVVMPSHFHWVFRPLERWVESLGVDADRRTPRERIMQSVKRFAANQCNQLLGQTGRFWQGESYDHWVRDEDELERIIDYVELNPVKGRLAVTRESYEYSSAFHRGVGL